MKLSRHAVIAVAGVGVAASAAIASDERRGDVVVVAHDDSEMVLIPAGGFQMGAPDSDEETAFLIAACTSDYGEDLARLLCFDSSQERDAYDDARPFREVHLGAYEIDRHEVTVDDYRRCARAGSCDPAPLFVGDQRRHGDGMPVVNVTWQDAVDFCSFRGKRLPSEAEWEKAARGRDGRRWPWGNHWREDGSNHGKLEDEVIGLVHGKLLHPGYGMRLPEYAADASDGAELPVAPGTMRWSDSPYGVFDLSGNVAEWVHDYYRGADSTGGGYQDLPAADPVRVTPAGGLADRAVRGGSWLEPRLHGLTYARSSERPTTRRADLGFRCARDVD